MAAIVGLGVVELDALKSGSLLAPTITIKSLSSCMSKSRISLTPAPTLEKNRGY
jgi:hypothetical protein